MVVVSDKVKVLILLIKSYFFTNLCITSLKFFVKLVLTDIQLKKVVTLVNFQHKFILVKDSLNKESYSFCFLCYFRQQLHQPAWRL